MTQADLLVHRAKDGNIEAIAALIAHQLAPKHITTQVNQKSGVLNILFEAEKTPSQAQLIPWITKALNHLQPQGIQQVRLYGRIQGQSQFVWKTQIQIHSNSPQQLDVNLNSHISHPTNSQLQPSQKPTASLTQSSSDRTSSKTKTPYQRKTKKTKKTKKRKLDILREIEESDTTTRILIGIAAIFAIWVLATQGLLSLIIGIALAIIPAHLAHQENKIFINWWVYGLIIFIVAIIHIFVIRLKRETKDGKDPAGKYGNDLEGINDLLLIFITCIAGIFYLAFFATFLFNDDIEAGLSALIVFGPLAIIPANTAKNKGYTRWKWWCYGLTLIPLAWIHANALHRKKVEKVTQEQTSKVADFQNSQTATSDYPNTIVDRSNISFLITGVIITGLIYSGIATPIGLIFLSGLAIIPANIAKNKGYAFDKWWCYGFMLFIVALIHSINLPTLSTANTVVRDSSDGSMKKCPYCAELIRAEAKLCRYCHSDLTKIIDQNQPIEQNQDSINLGTVAGVAVGVAGAVMVAEHIADAIAVAEAHEALSVAMDLADGAASALEAADSVVEMVEAIDAVSSAVEAMSAAGEAAAEAADALSSFGDFLDLFG